MANLDCATARALVEAGYMPLSVYIQLFGEAGAHAKDAPLVPNFDTDEPVSGSRDKTHHY